MDAAPLVELQDVEKSYDAGDGAVRPVLRGVSLRVAAGESLAVVGPSGSGKSTLLNLIGALDAPTSGRVLFRGRDLARASAAALGRLRRRDIGFVFQRHHLLPQCTALENVLVPTLALPRGERDAAAPDRARALLERAGLGGRMHDFPARLSGGESQRVALVRALVNRPGLVLADEPTGSLDHATARDVVGLLLDLQREHGTALVVVTHAGEIAARMGRRLRLIDGRFDDAPAAAGAGGRAP
jgi:predicted ABC-type transport system involved in lysophospholipase L1 biosynthesis ATPase subunit